MSNYSFKSAFRKEDIQSPSRSNVINFDEANLDETLHNKTKDYGLLKIGEANTPYPRVVAPVDASELLKRLKLLQEEHDLETATNKKAALVVTTQSILLQDQAKKIFNEKRDMYDKGEFTFTKQRRMSEIPHARGENYYNRENFRYSVAYNTFNKMDTIKNKREEDQSSLGARNPSVLFSNAMLPSTTSNRKQSVRENISSDTIRKLSFISI